MLATCVLFAAAVGQADVVGGYRAKFEDSDAALAATLGTELLRISPDGKFYMFRLEIEGTWERAGDSLVLTPTKVMGQSPDTFLAAMTERTKEFGEGVEEITSVLVLAFTAPFNLIVKPDGSLYQGPSLRGLDPYSWVRDKEPSLLERLAAMGEQDEDKFDMALYSYYYIGIQDDIEALTPELIAILDSDAAWNSRNWAATLLGHSKGENVVEALMRHVAGDHRVVNGSAQRAIAFIGDPGPLPRLVEMEKRGEVRYSTVADLIKASRATDFVELLIEGLDRESSWDRLYSLEALAVMPEELIVSRGAVKRAVRMLGEGETNVQANAAVVVRKWSDDPEERERAFETITGLVGTSDWLARADVAEGLAHFGFRAVRHLVTLLKDPMGPIRRIAAVSLQSIGLATALDPLHEAFRTEDDAMAREAMFRAIKSLEGVGKVA